ncbi:MAG: VCBS repeat-containing protein [Pseudomonadota bacterium]|nr:VCBS repeat-containing protein [Pseudomonadota bacterium]
MTALSLTSVKNNNYYRQSGALGGAGGYLTWTCSLVDMIGSIAGLPYTGPYTAFSGSMAAMTSYFGPSTWSNPALTAIGAPFSDTGVGFFAGQLETTSHAALTYTFSQPLAAGNSFTLVDPGASYIGNTGPFTYRVLATYQGAAVSLTGWTFTIVTPTGVAPATHFSINTSTGFITVNGYSGATWPDSVIIIAPNTPISTFTVTAQSIPYDFIAVTLPHIPSALLFQAQNNGGPADGALATWQINNTTASGGGVIGNPGPGWTYEGSGDFQGSGYTDMLFRNQSGAVVYWAVTGTSIASSVSLGNSGVNWRIVGIGDFNADGKSDILFEDSSGDLAIWEISGSQVIGGGAIGSTGSGWNYLATADFNGDGYADVLFVSSSGVYADWTMNGTTVAKTVTLSSPGAGWSFAGTGDFNGDGKADILFYNAALGQYEAWLMTAAGAIGATVTLATPGVGYALASIGTYTPSGCSDLVLRNTMTGALSDYVINNATLTSSGVIGNPGPNYGVAVAPYALPAPPAPTVFFTDSAGDIATWSVPRGVNQGGAIFTAPGAGWSFLAAGDFDGTGRPDILFQNAGNFALWETSGAQIVGGGTLGGPGGGWTYAGVGDFNGDGLNDLLFVDSSGNYATWLLNGATVIGGGPLGDPGAGWTLAAIADLTGNGTSDLIFQDPTGNYDVRFIANDAYAGSASIGNPGSGWTLVGTGDFNGDGKADLLFQGAGGVYATWDMNGASVIGGGSFTGPGAGWSYFGVADLNPGLAASILFRNASTGALAAYLMSDANVASVSVLGTAGAGWTPVSVI